jgi:hypothetical protein
VRNGHDSQFSRLTGEAMVGVLCPVRLNELHGAIGALEGKLHFQNVVASLQLMSMPKSANIVDAVLPI